MKPILCILILSQHMAGAGVHNLPIQSGLPSTLSKEQRIEIRAIVAEQVQIEINKRFKVALPPLPLPKERVKK